MLCIPQWESYAIDLGKRKPGSSAPLSYAKMPTSLNSELATVPQSAKAATAGVFALLLGQAALLAPSDGQFRNRTGGAYTDEELAAMINVNAEEFSEIVGYLVDSHLLIRLQNVPPITSERTSERSGAERNERNNRHVEPRPDRSLKQEDPKPNNGDVTDVWDAYLARHPNARLSKPRKELIARRLRDHSSQELIRAIEGNHLDPHCNGENDRGIEYHSIELILRNSDKIEHYIGIADAKKGAAEVEDRFSWVEDLSSRRMLIDALAKEGESEKFLALEKSVRDAQETPENSGLTPTTRDEMLSVLEAAKPPKERTHDERERKPRSRRDDDRTHDRPGSAGGLGDSLPAPGDPWDQVGDCD